MTTIRAFSPKIGTLFPISEKEQGRPPPLPLSSYAPWFLGQTDIIFNHKWGKTTKIQIDLSYKNNRFIPEGII